MAVDTAAVPRRVPARGVGPDPLPVAGLVDPVRPRRSWRYTAGAIAAILAGGLLSVSIYTATQQSESVFVVASTIERGATFTAADLTTITVTPGQGIDGYTPTEAGQVIGKIAAVTLPKGSLITRASVAAQLPVPAGEAVVGIAVKPSQMPATALTAGDHVIVTPVARQNATIEQARSQPVDVHATVVAPPTTDPSTGLVVVDVTVSTADASDLAGRAAVGQVAIYLTSGTDR